MRTRARFGLATAAHIVVQQAQRWKHHVQSQHVFGYECVELTARMESHESSFLAAGHYAVHFGEGLKFYETFRWATKTYYFRELHDFFWGGPNHFINGPERMNRKHLRDIMPYCGTRDIYETIRDFLPGCVRILLEEHEHARKHCAPAALLATVLNINFELERVTPSANIDAVEDMLNKVDKLVEETHYVFHRTMVIKAGWANPEKHVRPGLRWYELIVALENRMKYLYFRAKFGSDLPDNQGRHVDGPIDGPAPVDFHARSVYFASNPLLLLDLSNEVRDGGAQGCVPLFDFLLARSNLEELAAAVALNHFLATPRLTLSTQISFSLERLGWFGREANCLPGRLTLSLVLLLGSLLANGKQEAWYEQLEHLKSAYHAQIVDLPLMENVQSAWGPVIFWVLYRLASLHGHSAPMENVCASAARAIANSRKSALQNFELVGRGEVKAKQCFSTWDGALSASVLWASLVRLASNNASFKRESSVRWMLCSLASSRFNDNFTVAVFAGAVRHGSVELLVHVHEDAQYDSYGPTRNVETVPMSQFWTWECLYNGAQPTRVPARVNSKELIYANGTMKPSNLRLECPRPDFQLLRMTLVRQGQTHGVHLKFCAYENRKRFSTICTQPLHGHDRLETRWPGLSRRWLEYHLKEADHIQLYDVDGSFADLVQPYQSRGLVTYFSRWPAQVSQTFQGLQPPNCTLCTELLAYAHCAAWNRDVSKWILLVHSVDTFLFSPVGQSLQQVLAWFEPHRDHIVGLLIKKFDFGGHKESTTTDLIQAFQHRRAGLTVETGVPLLNPDHVQWISCHVAYGGGEGSLDRLILRMQHWPHAIWNKLSNDDLVHVDSDLMRVNHYFDMVEERCADCFVKDDGFARMMKFREHSFRNLSRRVEM